MECNELTESHVLQPKQLVLKDCMLLKVLK